MAASASDQELQRAISEAGLLLAYASANGIELTESVLTTIVEAGTWRPLEVPPGVEEKARFWVAFRALARAVHPVSPASIEATMARQGRSGLFAVLLDRTLGPRLTTHAERSIYRFSLMSFAVLAAEPYST